MPQVIVWAVLLPLTSAVAVGVGYLWGRWRTEERHWREERTLVPHLGIPRVPATPITTGRLREVEGSIKRYFLFEGSARRKGERRNGGESGDLY